jgi:hypothetical protein
MNIKYLNRYTKLPILLDLLKRKKLVLLDPKTWDDKNDSEVILEYAKRKKVGKLFALCFSYGTETIHHWKAYADGISGCCIEFNALELFVILNKIDGIRHGKVMYKKLFDMENKKKISTNKMPFYKRWPYRCENEYRVIWEGNTNDSKKEIDIPLSIIRRVTISQRMPQQVYKTIKRILKDIPENTDRVNRSTLYENIRWINAFR